MTIDETENAALPGKVVITLRVMRFEMRRITRSVMTTFSPCPFSRATACCCLWSVWLVLLLGGGGLTGMQAGEARPHSDSRSSGADTADVVEDAGVPEILALVNGNDAGSGAYPWMGAMLVGKGRVARGSQLCGCVLIHPSWAITAAHCVTARALDSFELVFGVHDFAAEIGQAERREVVEAIFSPDSVFPNPDRSGDIVLLRLRTPVTTLDPIAITSLPAGLETGGTVRVLGWGWLDNHARQSNFLQELDMRIAPFDDAQLVAETLGDRLEADLAPAGSLIGGTGICNGDSGSPLLARGPNGDWALAGIASFVLGDCGRGYSVFTNLQPHRQWLLAHLYPEFTRWAREHGIVADFDADHDGDGFNEFGEYAFGCDPANPSSNASSATGIAVATMAQGAGAIAPAIRFRRRDTSGLGYRLEASSDLENWKETAVESESIDDESGHEQGLDSVTLVAASDPSPLRALRALRAFRVAAETSANGSHRGYQAGASLFLTGTLFDGLPPRQPDSGNMRRVKELFITGVGETTYIIEASSFSPALTIYDDATGQVIAERGAAGVSRQRLRLTTTPEQRLRVVISSMEARPGNGEYVFHFPELPRPPGTLTVNRDVFSGVLDARSGFDGNYHNEQFQLIGATAGQLASVTLSSDPDAGGFRPFLVVMNSADEIVAETLDEPTDTTIVSFVTEPGFDYFAFVTTLLPGDKGTYRLEAVSKSR